ncbi:MAG: tRNA uridine-5-carboxymethylaminomethyl(34) synthesis GTPase MnmE [Flavobacteriales bacterium]|nr:tRNA uridine-5-carboxymethylaminomethyl(34) synthesis GTPase MnmE [Flavobacteriales bacterium]|tara:strand:+ start:7608 stop:8960 length:1353 start_codon:yes stop_codon:yes gene_type:complete
MNYFNPEDTICAITTGGGMSAIAIIRISGNKAIEVTNSVFSKDISSCKSHTLHFGNLINNAEVIDEVLVSIFKGEKSFTGEESIEISCHGSIFIQNKIIQILIEKGCRLATAGEFSMRAFKNGKLDLIQAESIADLIESESKAAHKTALMQLKGGVSIKLKTLRNQLIDFASLIELELDFSEEDVEFADRNQFKRLLEKIKSELEQLIQSFKLGNAVKNGIPVAILGAPNVGKSTLLNCLLNEEKSIVSDIAGTTRDAIEDTLIIKGYNFRFIDTAGIRETNDTIENLGIERTLEKANKSEIILFIIDATQSTELQLIELKKIKKENKGKVLVIVNKIDVSDIKIQEDYISISAKTREGISILENKLLKFINTEEISDNDSIVSNLRHYEQLQLTLHEIKSIIKGLENNISGDFLAINTRQALFHLGSITGEVTTDDLLGNIFGKFCIGK